MVNYFLLKGLNMKQPESYVRNQLAANSSSMVATWLNNIWDKGYYLNVFNKSSCALFKIVAQLCN